MVAPDSGYPIEDQTTLNWQVLSARQAIREGFPAIAMQILGEVLSRADISTSLRDSLSLDFATAAIADSHYGEAFAVLRDFSTPEAPRFQLLMGLIEYEIDSSEAAEHRLNAISPDMLSGEDLSWFHLLQFLLLDEEGDLEEASAAYQRAVDLASTSALRSYFELLRMRNQLKHLDVDENIITDLRQKLSDMQGQRGAFDTARLLAVALVQSGKPDDAIDLIENQLRYIGVQEADLRSQFYLLLGLIHGENSGRGRIALQQILLDDYATRQQQEMALELLAGASIDGDESGSFMDFLNDLLAREKPHPLADKLLIFRCRLQLTANRLDEAEADSRQVLEQYPGSYQVEDAIRILAYLSWKREPHQYRTAANYLTQLRTRIFNAEERARLGVLAADCLFLNGDYASAADAYGLVLREGNILFPGSVLYQQILSELRAGRIERAMEELDREDNELIVDVENRWRAEWNLVQTLRSYGREEEAFTRIHRLLDSGNTLTMPAMLRLRLMWLEIQLSVQMRNVEETPAQVDALLALLGSMDDSALPETQRSQILANTLLLKAEALYIRDQTEEGAVIFESLRKDYPQSEATALSYLLEARYLVASGNTVDAQRLLIALVDGLPRSKYAPIALWEAALNAELRGTNSTYQEAISLLERLIREYPKTSLTYQARLKQADLSRRLNDFGTALIIYEDLINTYPDHPDRMRAELNRADCYLAQSGQIPARRENAIAIYEKLVDVSTASVDMRIEAGYKWAYAVDQSGEYERASSLYWMIIHRVIDSQQQLSEMGPQGRYWLSRAIMALGSLLENGRRYDEARKIYAYVRRYDLPGQRLALSRLERLDSPK